MDLKEAKEILSELGIAEEISPQLVEASDIVLDRLEELEALAPDNIPTEAPVRATGPNGFPLTEDGECDCEDCREARLARMQRNQPASILPPIFPTLASEETIPVFMDEVYEG